MKIVIINGPNLNLLGLREPGIYGNQTFEQFYEGLKSAYPQIEFDYFQSNIEGELIDRIQKEGFSCDGILFSSPIRVEDFCKDQILNHEAKLCLDDIRLVSRN